MLAVGRTPRDPGERGRRTDDFSEADLNLLTTFADQAGAAVENATLYQEVRGASEELEKKVRLRTAELTAINHELGKALADLRETQAQLVLSERMAGIGVLVAGVAHEINSPTAAIRGSIDGLGAALIRVARHGAELVARTPGVIARSSPAPSRRAPAATSLTTPRSAEETRGRAGSAWSPRTVGRTDPPIRGRRRTFITYRPFDCRGGIAVDALRRWWPR